MRQIQGLKLLLSFAFSLEYRFRTTAVKSTMRHPDSTFHHSLYREGLQLSVPEYGAVCGLGMVPTCQQPGKVCRRRPDVIVEDDSGNSETFDDVFFVCFSCIFCVQRESNSDDTRQTGFPRGLYSLLAPL